MKDTLLMDAWLEAINKIEYYREEYNLGGIVQP